MSYGEKSCKHYHNGLCPIKSPSMEQCTVNCGCYEFDSIHKTENETQTKCFRKLLIKNGAILPPPNAPKPEGVRPPSQRAGKPGQKEVTLTIPSVTISGSAEERAIFIIANMLAGLARMNGKEVVEYLTQLYIRERSWFEDEKRKTQQDSNDEADYQRDGVNREAIGKRQNEGRDVTVYEFPWTKDQVDDFMQWTESHAEPGVLVERCTRGIRVIVDNQIAMEMVREEWKKNGLDVDRVVKGMGIASSKVIDDIMLECLGVDKKQS